MSRLDQFAGEFGVTVEELTIWIERRWVLPERSGLEILFDDADKARLKMVAEFHRDLAIDDETMPVVLGLIDQLHSVRAQLASVLRALDDLPEPQQTTILMRIKGMLDE